MPKLAGAPHGITITIDGAAYGLDELGSKAYRDIQQLTRLVDSVRDTSTAIEKHLSVVTVDMVRAANTYDREPAKHVLPLEMAFTTLSSLLSALTSIQAELQGVSDATQGSIRAVIQNALANK